VATLSSYQDSVLLVILCWETNWTVMYSGGNKYSTRQHFLLKAFPMQQFTQYYLKQST